MSRRGSLSGRLSIAGLLIISAFLGLTALVLDQAFYRAQLQSQRDNLRLEQLLLARAAEWDGRRWQVQDLGETRFNQPGSGLYAFILDRDGSALWHSPSARTLADRLDTFNYAVDLAAHLPLGDVRFAPCEWQRSYLCYSQAIAWGSTGPESMFLILRSAAPLNAVMSTWRFNLASLMGATAVLLLLAQWLTLRWGLRPLRRFTEDLTRLEHGEVDTLGEDYPRELMPLAQDLNQLLDSEQLRRDRVRNTMDRLAHVLKTPLMLLRNSPPPDTRLGIDARKRIEREYRSLVHTQVDRMLEIVEGELARARRDGRQENPFGKPVAAAPILERICQAYERLPRPGDGAPPTIDTNGIDDSATFAGDPRDLQDLFGSILENSIRHCSSLVRISAYNRCLHQHTLLVLEIGDDGPGVPEEQRQQVLRRGERADTAGHGLGLSIAVAIASAYGGSVDVEASKLGGALFRVTLPQRSRPE